MTRVFECLTSDDRHPGRQQSWLFVSDLDRAREYAARALLSDGHQRCVEIREDGRVLMVVDRAELAAPGTTPTQAAPGAGPPRVRRRPRGGQSAS